MYVRPPARTRVPHGLDECQCEQPGRYLHQHHKHPEHDGLRGTLSRKVLEGATDGIEQDGAAERPREPDGRGAEREHRGHVCRDSGRT
jgi:hypothetical protein